MTFFECILLKRNNNSLEILGSVMIFCTLRNGTTKTLISSHLRNQQQQIRIKGDNWCEEHNSISSNTGQHARVCTWTLLLTCSAHSIYLTGLLWWVTLASAAPAAASGGWGEDSDPDHLDQVLQRLLRSYVVAHFFDCVGLQVPFSQLLQEHPPVALLISHPGQVDLISNHCPKWWAGTSGRSPCSGSPWLICCGCSLRWWQASCPQDEWAQPFCAVCHVLVPL